jgi:phytoene dehydrogenase-like protein
MIHIKNNSSEYDVVVVGAGPNGLAAAITMAQAGYSVIVFEGKSSLGGGTRSLELTQPGFIHDICSSVHPLGVSSKFFRSLPLDQYGLEWIFPEIPLAHPMDYQPAVLIMRSLEKTAELLGADRDVYLKLMKPLVRDCLKLLDELLGPFPFPPYNMKLLIPFGLQALKPAERFAKSYFRSERSKAVFTGMAAHAMLPLNKLITTSFGLILDMLAHSMGWPLARNGSQSITNALASYLTALGGQVVTNNWINKMEDLPSSKIVFFDITPRQLLEIGGEKLPRTYRAQLERFRYGNGVFKIDYALSEPIPWKDANVLKAGSVHLGGTLEEIAASENAVWKGAHPEKPYVILVQPTLFDPGRAPLGKHIAWAYCHVPRGSDVDMTTVMERQIERFAPGFRDTILARRTHTALEMERYNPNYIGGDINGGLQDIRQFYTRPIPSLNPYKIPVKGWYLCSSSTPPGGGVHGMCGFHAANACLKEL